MGTKSSPSAYDCYANAEPDEPLFTLLARDKHAPALVALWACLRELDNDDEAKVAEARACAVQMMAWGVERGRKYVGFGQTTLAGTMELIRCANLAAEKDWKNEPTTDELLRLILSRTSVEHDGKKMEGV